MIPSVVLIHALSQPSFLKYFNLYLGLRTEIDNEHEQCWKKKMELTHSDTVDFRVVSEGVILVEEPLSH